MKRSTSKADGENEADKEIPPVTLRPKNVYGLRTDIIGNVHFSWNQDVIYPVEGVLAVHDFVKNKQRFMRFPEETYPVLIAISHTRKLLAVLENVRNVDSHITLYDIMTLRKKRSLSLPNGTKYENIEQIQFTMDSKVLVVLTKHPGEIIYMFILEDTIITVEGRPTMNNPRGTVKCIACNPQDYDMIAVSGNKLLMMMSKSEKGLTVTHNIKYDFMSTSVAFLSMDLLIVGTEDDRLVLVESSEVKYHQKASEADLFDPVWDQETVERETENKKPFDFKLIDKRVLLLTTFERGFAFVISNMVFVFEKVSKFRFERKTILTVPVKLYPEESYQITNMSIDIKQETVIVTTKHAQIYVGVLIVPETMKAKQLNFEPLGPLIHIGDIIDLSVCYWKPIIMTASKDQTIRIWNYETEQLELVQKFQVNVNIVELSSTGHLAAVGFSDQLRIAEIFIDELHIVKTYNFPRCKDVKYSNYGHFMAAAYDNSIGIASVYSLEVIRTLKGHSGTVLSMAWTKTDKFLISGGAEGAIYQWDVESGARVLEIVQKGTEYRSISVSNSDPPSIYAATHLGVLREFQNSELVREVIPPVKQMSPLTGLCLARSDLVMFIANEAGDIFNVQLPFLDASGGTCNGFRFFISCVNQLSFSHDGVLLVAVTKGGTLAIFALDNITGKVASMDQDLLKCQEVLIPRNVLKKKNEQIEELEARLKQQVEEFRFQLSQCQLDNEQKMSDIQKNFETTLKEVKRKNFEIKEEKAREITKITFEMKDLQEEHKKQLELLSEQYSERMLYQYQKYNNLRDNLHQLRDNYEKKLKDADEKLKSTLASLEADYKKQLEEQTEIIAGLKRKMQDKKLEFIEYCRQVEEENDRNMVQKMVEYENKLVTERNETYIWRGKAGVLQKKYESLSRDLEKLTSEVQELNEALTKSRNTIEQHNHNIEELHGEMAAKDATINENLVKQQEFLQSIQELEKQKQALQQKIAELKAQIEPKELQIAEKRKHILELENEINGLNASNATFMLQLKEVSDKYQSTLSELKQKQRQASLARECVTNICSAIYQAVEKMKSPEQLKLALKELIQKYAGEEEIKRLIVSETEVHDEFHRQRNYTERVLGIYKDRKFASVEKRKYDKLLKENIVLMAEYEKLRRDHAELQLILKKERNATNRK